MVVVSMIGSDMAMYPLKRFLVTIIINSLLMVAFISQRADRQIFGTVLEV